MGRLGTTRASSCGEIGSPVTHKGTPPRVSTGALRPAHPVPAVVPRRQNAPEHRIRKAAPAARRQDSHEVYAWRQKGYPGSSATSVALLRWWFNTILFFL